MIAPLPPVLLAAACSSGFQGDASAPELLALRVEPAEVAIETGPDGGPTVQFEAWGTFDEGPDQVLPQVEWSLSNRSVGTLDETGLFTPSTEAGGTSWVTARLDGLEAWATLTSTYVAVVDEDGAEVAFEGETAPWEDAWLYPEDGVNIPRNTPSIRFQWNDIGATAYRLRFTSGITDVTVFTRQPEWLATADMWTTIAAFNAGGSVEVELSAMLDGVVQVADPLTLFVNRMDATGAILYWSTSVEGLKQIPYGGTAEDFLTAEDVGACIGCHEVSATGTLAVTDAQGLVGAYDLADLTLLLDYRFDHVGAFKAFSPDGRWMLVTRDGELDDALAFDAPVTHPAWSPDGTEVVVVRVPPENFYDDAHFNLGALYRMSFDGKGGFGPLEPLYDPGDGLNHYYPAYSPDGAWVAFNTAAGDAYDNPAAEVWVLPAEGGDAIRLDRANRAVAQGNSWPRWGPLPDDDVLWLAFSSRRPYGTITEDNPQIWVAGFDPAQAALGNDPSWPAFWLPDQDPAENNHVPIWMP